MKNKISWPVVALVLAAWLPVAVTAAWPAMWQWSKTSATNASADGTINWREGQPPSSVNDSARAMMARIAEYRDDMAGAIVTGGTSSAYTLSSFQGFDTLAHLDGNRICFVPHVTNVATVTLSVDSLTAVPLRSSPSTEIGGGVLVQGSPYCATYNNSDVAFYLQGFYGNPYSVPLGSFMFHSVATSPNSNFILPIGQAISRTTYAAYFAMVGTTFGVGDGVTTFNAPDLRSRIIVPLATMGGADPGLVTTAGSGIDGATIGATGGTQNVTLGGANLPNTTLTVAIGSGQGAHTHGIGIASGGGSGVPMQPVGAANQSRNGTSAVTDSATLPALSGATSSINGNVTQTAVSKMPPALVLPVILRIF